MGARSRRRRPPTSSRQMADSGDIPPSEITPPSVYRRLNGRSEAVVEAPRLTGLQTPAAPAAGAVADGYRVDEAMTPLASVTHYNNFYEFTTDKDGVADRAKNFMTK